MKSAAPTHPHSTRSGSAMLRLVAPVAIVAGLILLFAAPFQRAADDQGSLAVVPRILNIQIENADDGESYPVLVYRRNRPPSEEIYRIEQGTPGGAWNPLPDDRFEVLAVTPDADANTESVKVRMAFPSVIYNTAGRLCFVFALT